MTAPKFRANYQELQQIAARFKGESDRAQQTMRSLKGNVEALRGGDWIGQGARKFYEEMDGQVFPTVNRLIAAMAEAQKVTLQISQIAQQAEADAAKILDKEPGDEFIGNAGPTQTPTPNLSPEIQPVPVPTPPPGSVPTYDPSGEQTVVQKLRDLAYTLEKFLIKNALKKNSLLPEIPGLPTVRIRGDFEGLKPAVERALQRLGVRSLEKELAEMGSRQLSKQLLRNIGKAVPFPVGDLIVDGIINTGMNIYENYSANDGFYKSILENEKFWAAQMKDTTFSAGSLLLKTGIVAAGTAMGGAAGAPAGGVTAAPTGIVGAMVSSAGAGAISALIMMGVNLKYGDQVKQAMLDTGVPGNMADFFRTLRDCPVYLPPRLA